MLEGIQTSEATRDNSLVLVGIVMLPCVSSLIAIMDKIMDKKDELVPETGYHRKTKCSPYADRCLCVIYITVQQLRCNLLKILGRYFLTAASISSFGWFCCCC